MASNLLISKRRWAGTDAFMEAKQELMDGLKPQLNLQVCVDRIFVGYRKKQTVPPHHCCDIIPLCKYQSVAGDLIKHLPRDDLDSGDDVEPAATVAVSYANSVEMYDRNVSISINETVLIMFPLLIRQPRNQTKSICITGSRSGQKETSMTEA